MVTRYPDRSRRIVPTHPEVQKAIDLAFGPLDAQGTWERSSSACNELQSILGTQAALLATIREKREEIEDAEADLLTTDRAVNAELSATAYAERWRVVKQQNPNLRTLRADLRALQAEADHIDAQVTHLKNVVTATSSRLRELSGLLYFFGVAKLASLSPDQQVQGAAT